MMRYAILIAMLMCLPVRGEAWQVVGGGVASGGDGYTLVFSDDFDRPDSDTVGGDWSSESDSGSNLSISSNTMIWDDNASTAAYVDKTGITDISEGAFECDILLSTVTVPHSRYTQIFGSVNRFIAKLATSGTTINQIKITWYSESGSPAEVVHWFTFNASTTYTMRLEFKTATATGATDGYYKIYINSSLVGENTSLDNYSKTVGAARVGNMYTSNWQSDADLTISFDSFALYEKN